MRLGNAPLRLGSLVAFPVLLTSCHWVAGFGDLEENLTGGAGGSTSSSVAATGGAGGMGAAAGGDASGAGGAAGSDLTCDSPEARLVFVTTKSDYSGDLGGLAGADSQCVAQADLAAIGGAWTAWLSTPAENARDRVLGEGPWCLRTGERVFADRTALLSGDLETAIQVDQSGNLIEETPFRVWTGTGVDGQIKSTTSGHCGSWTRFGTNLTGYHGDPQATDERWTVNGVPFVCGDPGGGTTPYGRLYCFEQ